MGADAGADTKKGNKGGDGASKDAAVPAACAKKDDAAKGDKGAKKGEGGAEGSAKSGQRFDRMAVRAKLAVSEPGDAVEREADAVASRVMRAPDPDATKKTGNVGGQKAAGATAQGGGGAGEKKTGAPQGGGAGEKKTGAPQGGGAGEKKTGPASGGGSDKKAAAPSAGTGTTKGAAAEQNSAVGKTGGAGGGDHASEPQAGKGKGAPAVQQRDGGADPDKKPSVPADFARQLGEGRPLDPETRAFFEQRLGKDLSHVRIHTDAQADAACKQIHARAFTYGNHVAFASGQFQPGSESGKSLIAHELVHVLQQQSDTVPRMIMRAGPGGQGAAAGVFEVTDTALEIPTIKSRHSPTYKLRGDAGVLVRPKGYKSAERKTAQRSKWLEGVTPNLDLIPQQHRPNATSGWGLSLQSKGGGGERKVQADSQTKLIDALRIPTWGGDGSDVEYQVDHMVEYQLGGADELDNMELLNQAHNGSVGPSFAHAIRRAVNGEVQKDKKKAVIPEVTGRDPTGQDVLDYLAISFRKVEGRQKEAGRKEKDSSFWSRQQIENVEHVIRFLGSSADEKKGKADEFVLLSPTGSLVINRFKQSGSTVTVAGKDKGGIAGFEIATINLAKGYNDLGEGAAIGHVAGTFDFGKNIEIPPQQVQIPLTKQGEYAGKLGTEFQPAFQKVEHQQASPMDITDLTVGKGVYAKAIIHPTHPALSGIALPGEIRDGKLGLFYTVDATTLASKLKIPGLTIDSASITLGFDGEDLSVEGGTEFTIRNFGTGHLDAKLDTSRKFSLEGGFTADTKLFDQADLDLWYRSEGGFGGRGTLAITTPGKIRGIKSARVTAGYDNGVFRADGSVQPDLPGVDTASLAVTYGPDASGATSLLISGDLSLKKGTPGIKDGRVHVDLAQTDGAWRVKANGEAHPNLPGIESAITLSYDDGTFDGVLDASFNRSIFSGTVKVGVTNRAVGPDGEVTGGAPGGSAADQKLTIYGGGTVTAKLTEHLQGGVGVKIKANGTMLLSGRIKTPSSIELFGKYPAPPNDRRELFHMPTLSIPLVGFSVGGNVVGLALTISGRIVGYAYVGPGLLTNAELAIEDFDPARPESLHVTGNANFDLPAAAGIEASLDAGVSLGAAVIRATAGINVFAAAGLEAHVRPRTELDWKPSTGLHLHADVSATLAPKLKFGLKGFAEVVADAFVTSFTLWRKEWNLAEKEIGSNLALGIQVPVEYYSDGRGVVFDPNKVTFQVPSLGRETFEQLLNSGGSEQIQRPEGRPS